MNAKLGIRVVCLAVLLWTGGALHAAPVQLPGSVDPGRVLDDKAPPEEPGNYVPPTRTEVPEEQLRKAATGKTFTLRNVILKGVTAYRADEFEELYRDRIGKKIDQAELGLWVADIQNRYRKDGYIFASGASGIDARGEATITVTEGKIGSVSVEGSSEDNGILERMAAEIAGNGPANIKVIERVVLLMNDLPGVTAKSVLEPAGTGVFDVTIVVSTRPAESSVSFDNYGSRYNGPFELTASTAVNGLTSPFSQTTIGGIATIPPDELRSVQIGHSIPLNADGTTGSVQLARVESLPGYLLELQDVESVSDSVQFQVSHPLIRSRAENLFLTASITARNTATDVLKAELSRDRVRIASATAAYDFQDALEGRDQVQLELGKGFAVLDASKRGDSNLSRAGANPDAAYVKLSAARMQYFTSTFGLYTAVDSQFAMSRLLSSVQFGYGGQRFGRAYDASEFTSDNGFAGIVELRYSGLEDIGPFSPTLFASIDAGHLWDKGGTEDAVTAASAAAGLRYFSSRGITGQFMAATPMTRPASAPAFGNGYAPRLFLSVSYRF